MSGRLLRKVLKEQDELQSGRRRPETGDGSDTDSDAHAETPSPSFKNPFDLLNDDDDENDSDITDESFTVNIVDDMSSRLETSTTKASSTSHKSKKKKKKKNKESSSSSNGVKPLDVMLEDLSFGSDSSGRQELTSFVKPDNINVNGSLVKGCTSSILQVDPRFLSAENELRRIFGSKVVNSFERSSQAGSSRQIRGGRRGSHNHRKTILVSPSDHWPRWDGSLSMKLLENKDGYNYFKYIHSSTYSQAQRAFEAAKATHDLNGIANILLYHPYHIDSLITLAEYFKFSGELQMSTDATAKCLYALECAWHPMFSPLQGNCRLKYNHEANRQLFSALFTHMKNMDRRGCHRSALEICKLLLSLDSDDPMGALFCIDYFSLRAEEYKWLEQFSEEYKSDNSLWLYPSFSYSLAICRFYLEREERIKDVKTESGKATSFDLRKQALMLHPSVLKKLVAKVPLKDQAWTKILKHSFFGSDQTGSPSLDHLITIYVERSYIIWRLPDLQNLLRDSAIRVIERLEESTSDARDWACVRKEAFSSEKNEYSHLLVSDFSDSVPTLPPDNLQNFVIDPRMIEMQNAGQVNPPRDEHAPPRDVANRNALAVLLESMLPWVDYGRRENGEDHDEDNED